MNPESKFTQKPTVNIENFDQNINLLLGHLDLVIRILVDQIVDFLGVNRSVVVQLFD